jgi:hypothetical protein
MIQDFKMRRFGRGRPVLGAAVLVGASRSAARHEVAKQDQMSAEAQRQADAAHQRQLQEEAERDQKTQLAIQAALVEERSRSKSPMPPVQHVEQSHQQRGAVAGYCAACGTRRIAAHKFCSECGTMHENAVNSGVPPPEYLETKGQVEDSKNLLA